jgi:hypothetical protein
MAVLIYIPTNNIQGFLFLHNLVNAYYLSSFFWEGWAGVLNSGLCPCKILPESHLQPILLWLFWRWGLEDYLPRLALNFNTPSLSLLSS